MAIYKQTLNENVRLKALCAMRYALCGKEF
jgi:hypothetical protein